MEQRTRAYGSVATKTIQYLDANIGEGEVVTAAAVNAYLGMSGIDGRKALYNLAEHHPQAIEQIGPGLFRLLNIRAFSIRRGRAVYTREVCGECFMVLPMSGECGACQ